MKEYLKASEKMFQSNIEQKTGLDEILLWTTYGPAEPVKACIENILAPKLKIYYKLNTILNTLLKNSLETSST